MSLLQQERETYEDLWSSVEDYAKHAPGEQYLPIFLALVGPHRGTVLDAGTGSGKGAVALQAVGFDVRTCDVTDAGLCAAARQLPFTTACLWHDLSSVTRGFGHPNRTTADFVYCTDVLEHIPPPFTMLCVEQMLRVCSQGLFLSVSLVPDSFGVWAGKPLHQSVFSFVQWRESLAELGQVVEARDLLHNGVYFVRPR